MTSIQRPGLGIQGQGLGNWSSRTTAPQRIVVVSRDIRMVRLLFSEYISLRTFQQPTYYYGRPTDIVVIQTVTATVN